MEAKAAAIRGEFEAHSKSAQESFQIADTAIQKLVEERKQVAAPLPQDALRVYNRTVQKFPMDPVVVVKDSTCSGCFMSIGPQILVQIARREKLVECPGCHRILVLSEMVAAETSA